MFLVQESESRVVPFSLRVRVFSRNGLVSSGLVAPSSNTPHEKKTNEIKDEEDGPFRTFPASHSGVDG